MGDKLPRRPYYCLFGENLLAIYRIPYLYIYAKSHLGTHRGEAWWELLLQR